MQKALHRIDELQNEMIQRSKTIDGADKYVEKKMALFNQDEQARKKLKDIRLEEQDLTNSFLQI
jgi:hypothetical protein